MESVSLLDSIRWLIRAWNHDILSSTITACFYKSTLVYNPVQLPIETPNLLPLYTQVKQSGRLNNCMEILYFLNPMEENMEADNTELQPEALLDQLIMEASGPEALATEALDINNQEDDLPEPPPLPKPSEALYAVRQLISYIEGQDESRTAFLRSLERFERDLEGEITTRNAQCTLDRWII